MVDQAMGLIQWSMNIIGSDGKACLMVLGHTLWMVQKSCTPWDVKNIVNNGISYQLVHDFLGTFQWMIFPSPVWWDLASFMSPLAGTTDMLLDK